MYLEYVPVLRTCLPTLTPSLPNSPSPTSLSAFCATHPPLAPLFPTLWFPSYFSLGSLPPPPILSPSHKYIFQHGLCPLCLWDPTSPYSFPSAYGWLTLPWARGVLCFGWCMFGSEEDLCLLHILLVRILLETGYRFWSWKKDVCEYDGCCCLL